MDGRLGIITDTYATPANVHDSIVYLGRLDRQRDRFGFDVGAVGLDAGYATSGIAKGLEDRGIPGVIGYRRPTPPRPGMMASKLFHYEAAIAAYKERKTFAGIFVIRCKASSKAWVGQIA